MGIDPTGHFAILSLIIGASVRALVSLIPYVGVLIEWTNEKWGWLDDVKQWFNDL